MDLKIEKSIEINAPVSRVWRALTDHREFGEWFRVKLEGPFVVGKVSRGQMTYPGFEYIRWEAVVEQMEPEKLFSFRWPQIKSHDKANYSPDYTGAPTTLVEFRLEKVPAGTLLTVTESGFENVPSDWRMTALRENEGGWTEQLKNIGKFVAERP